MLKCNVAVSGLHCCDDPAPGVAVIRSLRESGQWEGRIIGLAYDAMDTGLYDGKLVDEAYLLPYPFDRVALLERLKEIAHRAHVDVMVPLLDLELLSLTSMEPALRQAGISVLIPPMSRLKAHFKLNLARFCAKNNFRHPRGVTVSTPDKIAAALKELGKPIVVKGVIHQSHLASSAEEAAVYFEQIKSRWGHPVLLQEYIPGEEYNTDCLTDREGRLIGAVAIRKLRVTEKGKGWSGVTVANDRLLALSGEIIQALEWVGPIELEFIKHQGTDDYYLLEINPRLGAWIYLAARAGQNLPLAAVQIALGRKVAPLPPFQTGLMYVRYSLDIVCPVERLGTLTARGEFRPEKNHRG